MEKKRILEWLPRPPPGHLPYQGIKPVSWSWVNSIRAELNCNTHSWYPKNWFGGMGKHIPPSHWNWYKILQHPFTTLSLLASMKSPSPSSPASISICFPCPSWILFLHPVFKVSIFKSSIQALLLFSMHTPSLYGDLSHHQLQPDLQSKDFVNLCL